MVKTSYCESKQMSVYRKVCTSITGKTTYVESEDSDYEPPKKVNKQRKKESKAANVQIRSTRRKKQKAVENYEGPHNALSCSNSSEVHKVTRYTRKSSATAHSFPGSKSYDDNSSPWEFMPAEILSQIFGYVVATEGSALPCLNILRGVCKNWSSVANMSHLWTHMSFTPKLIPDERKFKAKHVNLYLSNKLHYTHTYHFARLHTVASRIITAVSDRSEKIKDLQVENCVLGGALGTFVKKHGGNLQKISIKLCKLRPDDWKKCESEFGGNLKVMEVINLDQRISLCRRSLNHLKNLTVLKLQYIGNFDIHHIKDLVLLQVLHLKETSIRQSNTQEFNHPKLKDVDLSFETRISFGHDALVEMLHNCIDLRRLSLRGRYVSIDVLCSNLSLCNQIIHLDISVDNSGHGDNSIGSLVHSIGSSLRELHIDKYMDLEKSLQVGDQYRSAWKSLRIVSMQGTNIQRHTLLSYLTDSICELTMLNVSTCRELPRGCKRDWSDIKSLKTLLKQFIVKE